MAQHLVKCFYCKQQFDANKEEFVKPQANRYAHKKCSDARPAEQIQEENDRKQLDDYIKQICDDNVPSFVWNQINTFHDNGKSYSGMYRTLYYYLEICHETIDTKRYGIAIIDRVWDRAREYYEEIYNAQEVNENKTIQEYTSKVRYLPFVPRPRQIKTINFTIEEDEDNGAQ
jgi:hypothetical protein